MATNISKIGRLLGMESKARRRKTAGADLATQAGTKVPRMLFNMLSANEVPILEGLFSHWEGKRNRYADAKHRKRMVDAKYHLDENGNRVNYGDATVAAELKKTRQDADRKAQAMSARENKASAAAAAAAEQGSSQIKLLKGIQHELKAIRGALHIGNKRIGNHPDDDSNQHGGAIRNWLENKLKNKFGNKLERGAIKIAGKRGGRLVRNLLGRGAVAAEGSAAELAGSGITAGAGAAAGEVAGAGAAAAGAGGGIAAGGSTLAAAALPAAAVAAAGAVGYGIGTLISKKLVEGTKAGDAIGSGIAHVLGFFGDKQAQQAIAENNSAGTGQVTPAMKAAWEKKHPELLAKWAKERAARGLPPVAATTVPAAAKHTSEIAKIASHFDPIAAAHAEEVAPPISATYKAGKAEAKPGTVISYLANLYDLASDKTKGIYVTAAQTPFSTPAPQKQVTYTQPAGAPAQTSQQQATQAIIAGPSTPAPAPVSTAGSIEVTASDYAPQPGAATNGGFVQHHRATGKMRFNVSAGSATGQAEEAAPEATGGSIGVAPKSYGKVGNYNIDTMWDSMKGIIAQGESGKAGYNAHHGGTINGLTNMTLGQLKHMTGAMGKYQILPQTTMVEAMRGLGLKDSDKFSPSVQEAMGKWLFARRVKQGATGKGAGAAKIQTRLADEWASLPKDLSGHGAYDGDSAGNEASGGVSKAKTMMADIINSAGQSGSVAGMNTGTADEIDSATNDVAKSDTSSAPVVIAPTVASSGGSRQAAPGTGSGLTGPMITRDSGSSVHSLTQNFMAGSSANRT